jgi:hypothetical protein
VPKPLLAAAAAAVIAAPASAGIENELNGQRTNNTLATAQQISPASFSALANPNVFAGLPTASVSGRAGANDIDVYSFFSPGGTARFDIDSTSNGFDSTLALFDASGTLLAGNDDSFPTDPGSATDLDAFIGDIHLALPGVYYIAVSSSHNAPLASFTGDMFEELTRPDGAFGGFRYLDATPGDSSYALDGPQHGAAYELHITIPSPGLAVCLLGAVVAGRRRARTTRSR